MRSLYANTRHAIHRTIVMAASVATSCVYSMCDPMVETPTGPGVLPYRKLAISCYRARLYVHAPERGPKRTK